MPSRNGAVHVATTKRTYRGKVYLTHLLRRSYREGTKVKHQTLGNLSHLPADLIETIRRRLAAGEPLGSGGVDILRSLPHGHVAAVLGTLRKIGLEQVLDNARRIAQKGKPMWIRTPVIPGYTDTEENIRTIARFIREELPTVERYDLLAFNNTCDAKYRRLDMSFSLSGEGLLLEEKMVKLAEAAQDEGLAVARWSGATRYPRP